MLLQEIRYSFRQLIRNPGVSVVAALSLALGIGANASIFSLADVLLFRPLPVTEPGSVVTVSTTALGDQFPVGVSYPNYRDLRDRSTSFEGLVTFQPATFSYARSRSEVAQAKAGMIVSVNFFRVLGIQPSVGRGFIPEEGEVVGRDAVVVLDYRAWSEEFGHDASIVGGNIRLSGIDFSVVGVAPESFTGVDERWRPSFYVPAVMSQRLNRSPWDPLEDSRDHSWMVKGRLKRGVTRPNAQAELTTIWQEIQRQSPQRDRERVVVVQSELQARARTRPDVILVPLLMALVGLVLIIACANVANLLLARARARSREISLRVALGVGRVRLLRQLFIESLILSLIAAAIGLVFAYVGIRFFQTFPPPNEISVAPGPQLDHRVLSVCVLAALASSLFFGMAPAWHSVRTGHAFTLKNLESNVDTRRTIGRNILVVGQVALSMVLVVATGMMLDAFRKVLVLDPGFRTDHLMMMSVDTSLVRYVSGQTKEFYRNLVDRAQQLPAVRSVSLTSAPPLGQQDIRNVTPEGYELQKGQETLSVMAAVVDEHYFDTMKVDMLQGRAFTSADTETSYGVAIVNEEFAKRMWPRGNALGKRLRLNDNRGPFVEVVGIAKTGKYLFVAEPPSTFIYLPFAQNPSAKMTLLAETFGDPAATAMPLRDVVHSLDADLPVQNVRTFANFYEQLAVRVPLMILETVAAIGFVGFLLALVGLYGLVSYSVTRRTKDMGIRMAIGAQSRDVLKMVLRQGMTLSLLGIAIGGLISIGVARLLSVGLAGLGAPNPATYVIAPVVLFLATMVACYMPARRASLVDLIAVLRFE